MASLAGRLARQREFSQLASYVPRWFRPRDLRNEVRVYRRRLRPSLRQWLLYHQTDVVFERCTWMGVKAWKNPLDAWIYQEIVHEVKPDVIVEIGSASGGTTLYLAHLLELIGHGIVVSVDIDRSSFVAKHERIVVITGSSSSTETMRQVTELCGGKRTIVIHDADHRKQEVLENLRLYAPLIDVGSYLIVEDGVVDLFRPYDALGVTYDGPLAATQEFLRSRDDFVVDYDRERYVLTYNPKGFLRRVR